jgi:hypothetical protein
MKNNRFIELNQIFEISQPQFIMELMAAGLPSEKISDAMLLLKETIIATLKYKLEENRISDLILLLNGVPDGICTMQTIAEGYASTLTSRFGVDRSIAAQVSHRILPYAFRKIGDYLPTSYLNTSGISRLLNFHPSSKSTLLKSMKSFYFRCILRIQFIRFAGAK